MWQQPKTNWYGAVGADGVYKGDRFNAADFNRIKNNLVYLRDVAIAMYDEFTIADVGADKQVTDYFYADEINALFDNLDTINAKTLNRSYGDTPLYYDNGHTPTFTELNQLEGATEDLYNRLINAYNGRRMFTWNFGTKGGL